MLKGKNEKPHGELDASGTITLCLDKSRSVISFNFDELTVNGQPTGGTHPQGRSGRLGPGRLPVRRARADRPVDGRGRVGGLRAGGSGLIAALIAKPTAYYVNVHTKLYKNGAIRGQLGQLEADERRRPGRARVRRRHLISTI